jgi:hypothetical protein
MIVYHYGCQYKDLEISEESYKWNKTEKKRMV